MLESVAKRLRETKQSWVNTQGLCNSETAFKRREEVLTPITSTAAIEESLNSILLKSPRSSQKQDDTMSDCRSELKTWSPRLDVAGLFGAGDDRRLIENAHEAPTGLVQRLREQDVRPCELTQRFVNLCDAFSDGETSASSEVDIMKEELRRPGTKMDQLRAMVQETSRQVGSAIGHVKGSHDCCLPAKDSGVSYHKADWFTQLKLTEPTKPYVDMSGSGSTPRLMGHTDPGNAQDVYEHIYPSHPSSTRSPMYCSARAALAKSQDLCDYMEPSLASIPSSPVSSKHSSAGCSVSSSRGLPPRPSKLI